MTLVTHQTGPQGRIVKRVYVEDGCDIARELYLGAVLDRATSRVTFMASTEGGVEIEEVAAKHPGEDHQGRDRPGHRLPAVPRPRARLRPRPQGQGGRQGGGVHEGALPGVIERDASLVEINPLVVTADGDLVALDAKMNFDNNALFRQPKVDGAARPRRGGPARDRGQPARAQLHQARRQHRLHGQRRRPRHGDHGHHQAVRRRAGQLPRRRRRRHQGAGDRGLQAHAVATPTSRACWSTSSAASCAAT